MRPSRTYAGVLPFAVAPNGTVMLLLAKEAFGRDVHKWSGFGGGVTKGETAIDAAVRECYEELNGLLLVTPAMLEAAPSMPLERGGVQFLLRTHFDSRAPEMFAAVRRRIQQEVGPNVYSPFLEKSEIAWVPLHTAHRACVLRGVFYRDMPTISTHISKALLQSS